MFLTLSKYFTQAAPPQSSKPRGNTESLTSKVFSNSRIGSNSTHEQEEEDKAPLQSGELFPFLQAHRQKKDGEKCLRLSKYYGSKCAFVLHQTRNQQVSSLILMLWLNGAIEFCAGQYL